MKSGQTEKLMGARGSSLRGSNFPSARARRRGTYSPKSTYAEHALVKKAVAYLYAKKQLESLEARKVHDMIMRGLRSE